MTLASGQKQAGSLAVGQNDVYWSSGVAAPGSSKLMRVGLNGGTPVTLVSGQDGPMDVALGGDRVLWTSQLMGTGGSIQSRLKDGSSMMPLTSGAWYPYPGGVAVWGQGGVTVVWAAKKVSGGAVVMSASLYYGGSPATLATVHDVSAQPEGIATDAVGNAYWTDSGTDTVMKVGIMGGAPVTLASNQAFPMGIAVEGTNLYWTNYDGGTVMTELKNPPSGAAPSALASGQSKPGPVAADASHAYWANRGASTVMRLSLGGGNPVTLVSGQVVADIAVDATSVYWTNPHDGTVMKLTPK